MANYNMQTQTEDTGKQTKLRVPWNAPLSHEDMYPASYSISTKQSQHNQSKQEHQTNILYYQR